MSFIPMIIPMPFGRGGIPLGLGIILIGSILAVMFLMLYDLNPRLSMLILPPILFGLMLFGIAMLIRRNDIKKLNEESNDTLGEE